MPKFKLREVDYGKETEGREKRRLQVKPCKPCKQTLSMIDALQKIHNETRNEEKSLWSR